MPATLPRELMLNRMLASDAAYDGQFITGVITTGIYCLPSCRARKPKPENVLFYATPAEARTAGFRACLRCKPDDFAKGIYPKEKQLSEALENVQLGEVRTVADLARHVGVSASTLHELFLAYQHATPANWLASRRIAQASTLLLSTRRTVAEIAFSVGFESLSSFGTQFRRMNAMTPRHFRQMLERGGFELRLACGGPEERQQRVIAVPMALGSLEVAMTFGTESVVVQPCQSFALKSSDWLAIHAATLKLAHSRSFHDQH
ncbi:bifunctional transcriptional activator/DNA repair enzyme AdaA [Deinococcus sp.]|uniref:bifunctional transcriptional activator/DNA repair enzyme AdaA n=1 Tax=Deinococcus sp. TaxID=47478 RepID=UPI003B5A2B89